MENMESLLRKKSANSNPHNMSSFYRLNANPKITTKENSITRRVFTETQEAERIGGFGRSQFNYLEEDFDDDSYMFDSDDDLFDDKSPKKNSDIETGQNIYKSCCKSFKLVPISTFDKQLTGDTVSLQCQNLHGNIFKSMAIALTRNHTVTKVDLERDNLGSEEANILCELLQCNYVITNLNLSGNHLGSEGLQYIAEVMKKNKTLLVLNISDNGFVENDAIHVKTLLTKNKYIEELYISKNRFEDKGGSIIADGLAKNISLRIFDLSWNHIREEGGSAIGMSLMKNKTLEILDVSWNGFGRMGCHGLGQGLNANTSLIELNVSCNRMGVAGLCKLLEGLKRNKKLQRLKIGNNPISQDGAMLALKVMERLSNITDIDLGNQPVSEDFVGLVKKINSNRKLTVTHGKTVSKVKAEEEDDTMYISGDPYVILFEFTRMKKIDIHDLFITFDTDGSHTITWEEFKLGIKKVHIPLRIQDIETIIKKMDMNRDREVNFSELIIAQKEHNNKAEKLEEKGQDVFEKSAIGRIHKDLHHWFCDKEIYLKRYRLSIASTDRE